MCTTPTQTTEDFLDLVSELADLEQDEVIAWAEIARACRGHTLSFVPGCEDHRFCRLPFNLVAKDRQGRPRIELCTSKSLGAASAVLICRKPLTPFEEVQLQLDDELDRPWVRAKVIDTKQTIGGHAVCVEFLTEARQVA